MPCAVYIYQHKHLTCVDIKNINVELNRCTPGVGCIECTNYFPTDIVSSCLLFLDKDITTHDPKIACTE